MPIYEYSCKKCGQTIEVIQKMSDPELKKHKQCGGALTKLISASGFQFKGTGWYVTDYAKTSQPKGSDSSEGSDSSSETKEKKESKDSNPAPATAKDNGGKTSERSSKESSKGSSESSKDSSSSSSSSGKTSKSSDSKK